MESLTVSYFHVLSPLFSSTASPYFVPRYVFMNALSGCCCGAHLTRNCIKRDPINVVEREGFCDALLAGSALIERRHIAYHFAFFDCALFFF